MLKGPFERVLSKILISDLNFFLYLKRLRYKNKKDSVFGDNEGNKGCEHVDPVTY